MEPTTRPALRVLLAALFAQLGMFALHYATSLFKDDAHGYLRVVQGAGTLVTVVMIVGFGLLAREEPRTAKLAMATAVTMGILLLLDFALPELTPRFGYGLEVMLLMRLPWIVVGLLEWRTLRAVGTVRGGYSTTGLDVVFACAYAARTAFSIASAWAIAKHDYSMFLFAGSAYVQVITGVVVVAVNLALVYRARGARGTATVDVVAVPSTSASEDILMGALWLGGGIAVTIGSYIALHGAGGHFVVTTGAIAYGIGRLIRGYSRS